MNPTTPPRPAESLGARFQRLASSTMRRIRIAGADAPQAPPDPEAALVAALGEWAADAPTAFHAWLRARIESAHAAANAGVGTAPGAWWLGHEAGLREVRDLLNKMRGQPAGTPPARPAA